LKRALLILQFPKTRLHPQRKRIKSSNVHTPEDKETSFYQIPARTAVPIHFLIFRSVVLTMGRSGAYTANPPEKGGKKKKNPGIYTGQPAGKGREKKNPGIYTGQPVGKGRGKKKPWHLHWAARRKKGEKKRKKKTLVLTLGSPPDLDFRT
jgi:hypothetical protein